MSTPSYSNYPSSGFAAVATSDTVVQPKARWVLCLTAGNLVADNAADVTLTIPMTAGQTLPISPKRIKTTSTGTYALLR